MALPALRDLFLIILPALRDLFLIILPALRDRLRISTPISSPVSLAFKAAVFDYDGKTQVIA
jgi:hypothetical protein